MHEMNRGHADDEQNHQRDEKSQEGFLLQRQAHAYYCISFWEGVGRGGFNEFNEFFVFERSRSWRRRKRSRERRWSIRWEDRIDRTARPLPASPRCPPRARS